MSAVVLATLLLPAAGVPRALAAPTMLFPWDKAQNPWYLTQGPHGGVGSGLDFDRNGSPQPVLAMFEADVTFAGHEDAFPCYINDVYQGDKANSRITLVARDGSGWSVDFLHVSEFSVQVGDTVPRGYVVGKSGNVGCSAGNHLHVELKVNGAAEPWSGKTIDGWAVDSGYAGQPLNSTNAPPAPAPTASPTPTPTPSPTPTATTTVPPLPTVKPSVPSLPTVRPSVPPLPTVRPSVPPLPTVRPSVPPLPTVRPSVPTLPTVRPTVPAGIEPDINLEPANPPWSCTQQHTWLCHPKDPR